MSSFTSYGACMLCGKRTTKAGMTRHLATCPAQHEPASGQPAPLYRLRVEDAWRPYYWMDVEIKASASLAMLDDFLRRQWLECCGHLSSFFIGDTEYTVPIEMMDIAPGSNARDMAVKVGDVLGKGSKFTHLYDFGTSTDLKLRVADEREGRLGREPLRLLSRNEAPVWECDVCNADATWICTVCMYEHDNPFYCDKHANDHDCEDPEMLLPVVNSPRMGQCAYGSV